jgi:hypothetical protein
LLAANGAVLAQGSMLQLPSDTTRYMTALVIPSEAFRLEISATGADGVANVWLSSRIYQPLAFRLRVLPEKALLYQAEAVKLVLAVESATAAGSYALSLALPAGFSAGATSWVVNLTPGQTTSVSTILAAPLKAGGLSMHTLLAEIAPTSNTQDVRQASIRIIVE